MTDDVIGPGLPLLVWGGALTLEQLLALVRGLRTADWQRTTGHVLEARVGGHLQSGLRLTVRGFWPAVRYEYTVRGTRYESRTVGYGGGALPRWRAAARTAATYQPGRPVPVWYDPERPARAVLVPGTSAGAYARVALGAALAALGWWWL